MTIFLHKAVPVLVEWIDSVQTMGWGELHEPSDMRCVSVGILVSKTKDRLTLAVNYDGDSFGHFMEIPLVAIKKIRKLK